MYDKYKSHLNCNLYLDVKDRCERIKTLRNLIIIQIYF